MIERGGALRVADATELGLRLEELLADEGKRRRMADHAREMIEDNRGALDRSAEIVLRTAGRPT